MIGRAMTPAGAVARHGWLATALAAGSISSAGCVYHHHHHRDYDEVVIVDDYGFPHHGYYDEHRWWHGGYYDRDRRYHEDARDWRRAREFHERGEHDRR